MTNFSDSFKSVQNLPTVNDGSLKSGIWTTKLALANIQAVLNEDETVTFTYQGKTYIVPASILANRALLEAASGKIGYIELFELMASGFLSPMQRDTKVVSGSDKEGSLEPENKIISSAEYRTFILGEAEQKKAELITALHLLSTSGLFTPSWIETGTKALDKFKIEFTPEQQAVYDEKVAIEEKAKQRLQTLTDAGFTKILPCVGYKDKEGKSKRFQGFVGTISNDIPIAIQREALKTSDYIAVYAELDEKQNTRVVYFKDYFVAEAEDSLI